MLPEPRRNRVHKIVGVAVEQDDYYNCQYAQLRRENVGQATARVALHGHLCSPAQNAIAGNDTTSIIASEPKSSLI
jgi:predicted alpha/beta hydrolase family esterase